MSLEENERYAQADDLLSGEFCPLYNLPGLAWMATGRRNTLIVHSLGDGYFQPTIRTIGRDRMLHRPRNSRPRRGQSRQANRLRRRLVLGRAYYGWLPLLNEST